VVENPRHPLRERTGVPRRHEESGLAVRNDLGNAAGAGGRDRNAGIERFEIVFARK